MDICIVGGGIAGLGLAGFLEQNGFEYTVIEQAEEWKRVGWGIGLWGTGIQVLESLGVAQKAVENGTEMNRYHLRNGKGEEIASYTVDSEGLEFLAIHRADLHEALRQAVPQENIQMGSRPERMDCNENSVEVVFENGESETFDLVVGADGMHSKVREECFSEYEIKKKDIAVWSFWTEKEKIPEGTTSVWTTGTEAFLTNIQGKGLVNVASRIKAENRDQYSAKERLSDAVEGIGWELIRDIVEDVDGQEFFSDTIKTVDAENWRTRNVVLIGDAAHALNPIVGMGASLALEDAYVLAEELQENPAEALRNYQNRRRKPVRSVRRRASIMEWVVFNNHSIVPYIGNALLKRTSSLAEYYYQNMSFKDLDQL